MNRKVTVLAIIAIAFGIARFVVPVSGAIDHADIFKDLSHVFVGGCFGAAINATFRTIRDRDTCLFSGRYRFKRFWMPLTQSGVFGPSPSA